MIEDIDGLPDLPIGKLRELWAQHVPRQDPPRNKMMMARELARIVQERMYGGMDAQTKRLLDAAVRAAEAAAKARLSGTPPRPVDRTVPVLPGLAPGSRLVRTWRGRDHEVTVVAQDRFLYQGKEYASLSEIARFITGTRWSGPRFFGLARRTRL